MNFCQGSIYRFTRVFIINFQQNRKNWNWNKVLPVKKNDYYNEISCDISLSEAFITRVETNKYFVVTILKNRNSFRYGFAIFTIPPLPTLFLRIQLYHVEEWLIFARGKYFIDSKWTVSVRKRAVSEFHPLSEFLSRNGKK